MDSDQYFMGPGMYAFQPLDADAIPQKAGTMV
jgi:hypothetical protein